jgi:hypothetical protein
MRRASVTKIGLCAALALTIASAGCITIGGDNLRGKAKRTDNLTAPVGAVSALKVTTNIGRIDLDATDDAEVRITADITVRARTDEEAQALLERVRITAEPSGDTFVVKAKEPSGFGHNQLAVDLAITAPPALRLDCTTNVGDVRISDFSRRAEVRTDVGSITCSGLRDSAFLHTNVGYIEVAYSPDAPAALDVNASANIGNIDFTGPSQISANLTAAANVGDIHTHRPLTVSGSLGKSVKASLGDAEGKVDLRANVGSITIR